MSASFSGLPQNDAGSGAEKMPVHAGIEQRGGALVPISCAMYLSGGSWKVYAVKLSGVSQVTRCRSGSGSSIRKDGLDSLVEQPVNRNNGVLYG